MSDIVLVTLIICGTSLVGWFFWLCAKTSPVPPPTPEIKHPVYTRTDVKTTLTPEQVQELLKKFTASPDGAA